VATTTSILGGTTAAAAGFAIGTVVLPGIGSVVGTLVGGISGSIAGRKLGMRFYKRMDDLVLEKKLDQTDISATKYKENDYYDELFEEEERKH